MQPAARPSAGWVGRTVAAATAHPARVLACSAALVALSFFGLPRLQLRGGIYELFPRRPGPIADLALHARRFGARGELVALVEGTDAGAVARTARWLRVELERSPLIGSVVPQPAAAELSRALGPHLFALLDAQGWATARHWLTSGLADRVARLRRLLLLPVDAGSTHLRFDPLGLSELLGGSAAIGRAGGATLVVARPRGAPDDLDFCAALDRALGRLAQRRPRADVALRFTGGHLYALHISRLLRRDLTTSAVVALAAVVLLFLLFFRSWALLPLVATVPALAVLFTLALAAWTVGRLNALSLSFAAICIGLGADAAIHIASRLRGQTMVDARDRVRSTLAAVGPALVAATCTTLVALFGFGLSAFRGLAHTGLLAGSGVAFSLLLALTLLPALLVLWPPRLPSAGAFDRWLAALGRGVRQRHRLVLVLAALVTLPLVGQAGSLRIEGELTALAPADLPPAQTDRAIAAALGRPGQRQLVLTRAADLQRGLAAAERVAATLRRLQAEGQVVRFSSPVSWLPSGQTQRARLQRLAALGPVDRRVREALLRAGLRPEHFAPFFKTLSRPQTVTLEGLPAVLRAVVERQLWISPREVVIATHVDPGSDKARARISAALGALSDADARVSVTGARSAGRAMAEVLGGDLLLLGGISVLAAILVLGLLLRRPVAVAAVCGSLGVAAAAFCGLLALLGIRLDIYTVMTIPLLVGYGVDDHIYVARHLLDEGVGPALAGSGRAVITTTATSVAAFGALVLCGLPGLRQLGLAAVLGLLLTMLASLLLLPALLALLGVDRE